MNKRMNNVVKKGLAIAACTLTCMTTAFAGNVPGGTGTTPVHLTVSPEQVTVMDVTVSSRIDLTGKANSNDLTGQDFVVTNNSKTGSVVVKNLKATAGAGWTVGTKAEDYKTMPVNTKKVAVIADNNDLNGVGYSPNKEIAPSANATYTITGKTATHTKQVEATQAVANIVSTIAWK